MSIAEGNGSFQYCVGLVDELGNPVELCEQNQDRDLGLGVIGKHLVDPLLRAAAQIEERGVLDELRLLRGQE